ncbi:MAG: tetratricopeptide repeat protein, partial [Candidatus Dadabacteria bacterium]|nr:tetratricopeptide repeat protein [Candidatus Dadabacteria bacterium]
MNDLESSIAYFNRAIEICPEDAYLWTQYGITLYRKNKHHQAINIFRYALVIDPTYTVAKWNLGLTYRSIGHYEDAVEEFTECLELESDSDYFKDEIHYQLGLCYFDMGWTPEAISEFRKHTDIYPDDIFCHLSIGNCYFDLGWIDESVERFRFIIDKNPSFIPAYNSLAISYAEKGW